MTKVFVKSLPESAKDYIVNRYTQEIFTVTELAKMYQTSRRTIGRVLEERGVASPVARLQGKAYRAVKLMDKYDVNINELDNALRQYVGIAPHPYGKHPVQKAALFRPVSPVK